jgi:hypothetical protein
VGFVLAPQLWKRPFDPKDPIRTPSGLNVTDDVRKALVAAIRELKAAGFPSMLASRTCSSSNETASGSA